MSDRVDAHLVPACAPFDRGRGEHARRGAVTTNGFIMPAERQVGMPRLKSTFEKIGPPKPE
jgi:hypothetical protein